MNIEHKPHQNTQYVVVQAIHEFRRTLLKQGIRIEITKLSVESDVYEMLANSFMHDTGMIRIDPDTKRIGMSIMGADVTVKE